MRLDLEEPREDLINLVPLIDIVFLLLVFFLVATTFVDAESELALELPKAHNGSESSTARPLVILVAEDGTWFVDGRPVTEEGLEQKLLAAAASDPDREVLIRGHTRVALGRVVQAFDACAGAALRRVSIAAEPLERER